MPQPNRQRRFPEEWTALIDLMAKRGFAPFVNIAYLGFGGGLEEDAWSVRQIVRTDRPVFVAASFSKSFSLYSERVGVLGVVGFCGRGSGDGAVARVITRVLHSSPPGDDARLVSKVLNGPALRAT